MFAKDLLKGKSALLLGATSGIGLRAAEGMAAAGATKVMINGRGAESGLREQKRLAELFPQTEVVFVQGDFLCADDVNRVFDDIEAQGQGIDILVHTCATGGADHSAGPKPFTESDAAYWQNAIQGIFLSLLYACQRAIPVMQKRGGGVIVDITSDAARVATPGEALLGGLLAANNQFLKTIALEHGRDNIRTNIISPSITTGT